MESDNIIQLNEMDVSEINSGGLHQQQSWVVRISEQQSTNKVTENNPHDEYDTLLSLLRRALMFRGQSSNKKPSFSIQTSTTSKSRTVY